MRNNRKHQVTNLSSTHSQQIVELDDNELDNITGGITTSDNEAREYDRRLKETADKETLRKARILLNML